MSECAVGARVVPPTAPRAPHHSMAEPRQCYVLRVVWAPRGACCLSLWQTEAWDAVASGQASASFGARRSALSALAVHPLGRPQALGP